MNNVRGSGRSDPKRHRLSSAEGPTKNLVGTLHGSKPKRETAGQDKRETALPRALNKRPASVEQAISQLTVKTWARLARDVFHCEPEFLDIETVLHKIEETNTCLNLDSPVEVAIDLNGAFTVLVYDRAEP